MTVSRPRSGPRKQPAPPPPVEPLSVGRMSIELWIAVLLAALTIALYWPVHGYDFVNYDDVDYVRQNAPVRAGLTAASVTWAFTTLNGSFWIPLTWLSFMADSQLYGTSAGGYHVTNVLLHAANSVLLFVVLLRGTGRRWASAFVACLFAVHPLHVESVAWVTERKDVLSTLFLLLTLWSYGAYAARPAPGRDHVSLSLFALGLKPDDAEAHNNLANALAERGAVEGALAHYTAALRIRPAYAAAHVNLALFLAEQGRFPEAVEHYLAALTIRPDDARVHADLGNVLAAEGRVEEAVTHYAEAIRLEPDHAAAHSNYGNALVLLGRADDGIAEYSEALRLDPQYAEAHYNLGIVLAERGRTTEAIAHYREALRIKPAYAAAHTRLGIALRTEGRLDEAKSHFAEALRIDPASGSTANGRVVGGALSGRDSWGWILATCRVTARAGRSAATGQKGYGRRARAVNCGTREGTTCPTSRTAAFAVSR